jgi:hypothetical protein
MTNLIIEIAYDKKNKRFVAYNLEANVVATGVCVTSAVENFQSKRLEKIAEFEEESMIRK